jgi:hypothetical protein
VGATHSLGTSQATIKAAKPANPTVLMPALSLVAKPAREQRPQPRAPRTPNLTYDMTARFEPTKWGRPTVGGRTSLLIVT